MAVSEQERYELHQRLEAVLGSGEANTLMEYLPPVGWADVARKNDLLEIRRDVEALGTRIDRRLDQVDGRLERLGTDFRNSMLAVMSMIVVLVAAMVAAIKI